MSQPLLMDVDTGIDDALALLLAVRSPELDLVGVGAVAGNVDVEQAARNSLRVLEVADAAHVPVALGAARPLVEPFTDARWIHGDDGLGDSGQPDPTRRPSDESAVEQLLRLSYEHRGTLVVVAVGPLTNLALALSLDPTLASRLCRVVIMGGTARVGGNRTPWAEANLASDPEAAAIVFAAAVPRTMIGLDVTMQVRLTDTDVAALGDGGDPAGALAAAILPRYLDGYERWSHERWCALHDPVAVAVAARPDLVTTVELDVQIETTGRFTRGMSVVDLRGLHPGRAPTHGGTTAVALEVDAPSCRELFLSRLGAGARPA